jgi:hypothetical protein
MRRKLTMLVLGACLVAAAALPAAALAHHGHHKRDRTISGTVASFDNGMLAIKKANGNIVTAKVVGRTEIECENENEANDSRARAADHGGDGNSADDNGGDRNENEVEQNDQNDDNGVDQNQNQASSCDDSQLTPGAVVSRARLRDRGDADFWKNLKLAL